MLLFSLKHLVLLISLSNVTLALKTLIGYRRVNRLEAFEINQRRNIFRDPARDDLANRNQAAQIGNGVYLSMTVNGYDGERNDWWCYVLAEMGPLGQAPKVWIPKRLWDKPEINTAAYVQGHLNEPESPDYALRLSQTKGYPSGYIQMLIPTRMVQDNTLGTSAYCYRNRQELPYHQPVSYDWRNFRNHQ
ncbi:uncharacterized protein LY79DRAFT_564372 [Colletotrichum navitas]|uniref:Uncharacterized protein n=1 Tax=Colletotrichum navitas TaxID=681940 RepID=A0AAD8PSU4_9PEZI|nr:uncharacterized protein LY79DRAFT_564372 [Colletotrichum navitas]KAK1579388.1 hypothetical protein LY79DRAFT_564372 [Colletotrichum navitas]